MCAARKLKSKTKMSRVEKRWCPWSYILYWTVQSNWRRSCSSYHHGTCGNFQGQSWPERPARSNSSSLGGDEKSASLCRISHRKKTHCCDRMYYSLRLIIKLSLCNRHWQNWKRMCFTSPSFCHKIKLQWPICCWRTKTFLNINSSNNVPLTIGHHLF